MELVDGIKLKERRNDLGKTQQELADDFGVKRNTINRWENGILEVPKWVSLALQALEIEYEKVKVEEKAIDEKQIKNETYFNKSALKGRGWTDAMIRDLLSETEIKRGLTCDAGQKDFNFRYFYEESKVKAIEKTKAFKEWKQKKKAAK